MAAAVLRFEFKVLGQTREECIDTLDQIVGDIITKEGGEPWVTVTETYEKQMLNKEAALAGDPTGFVWMGVRSVVFTGPTPIGEPSTFRDGFRPQSDFLED